MTVVVDESVSYGLVEVLRQAGHEVISVAELPTVGMADEQVFQLVQERSAVLITRDYHFTNAVRFPAHLTRGILYIRRGNLTAAEKRDWADSTVPGAVSCRSLCRKARHTLYPPRLDSIASPLHG